MFGLWTITAAGAFCGGWVTYPGEPIANTASRVVLARNAGELVLTLAADALDAPADLGLLVPVPEGLGPADVAVVDPALLDALDGWSAPRGVALTCADLTSDTGADTDSAGISADGVTLEAQFVVGAWEVSVVSGGEGGGLADWLVAEGFEVPEALSPVLDEYLAAGQWFVAARLTLEAQAAGSAWPDPLQLRYPWAGESFTLPVRLGAASSLGEQEVVAWVITDAAAGRVAVSNAPEGELPTGCQRPEGTELAGFYSSLLEETFAEGVWATEFAGFADAPSSYPTSEVPDLAAFGATAAEPFVTRLRFRYTPAEAAQDFVLYPTRTVGEVVPAYFEAEPEMDAWYPVCGQEPGDGDCGAGDTGALHWGEPPDPEVDTAADAAAGSCAAAPGLLALALAAGLRRGRR